MSNNSATTFPDEPVLDIHDIQGNILAGFNKDYQTLLFFKVVEPLIAKTWLMAIAPLISTVQEVLSFNRLFKLMRKRQGHDPSGMAVTWMNIAFSFDGLMKLTKEADQFQQDAPFRIGLPKRSGLLSDPTDPTAEGNPKNWVIGGTNNVPDIIVILASDDRRYLETEVNRIKASINSGLTLITEQLGSVRPDLPGHEHFGFKDGISQPGIRGYVSNTKDDFLTPRFIDPKEQDALTHAKPGQPLIWPGQFVFGYPQQDVHDPLNPKPPVQNGLPSWAKNGSFLVFRRLRQDVVAFKKFVSALAKELATKPGFEKITPELLATKLVGRWPSGAPIMRISDADNKSLGNDDFANNHFNFVKKSDPVALVPIPGYSGDNFPLAPDDVFGMICPHAAHIRKVNPRDDGTDTGGANDTLTRRILRRGIPYGEPLSDTATEADDPLKGNRGLLFISYQTSISDQFEFLVNRWTNQINVPLNGGHDPIIGQNGKAGENRSRQFEIVLNGSPSETLSITSDWVIPTGGGYFFAPSISALKNVLAN